ncbi:MAG: EamA family transporter [Oscillibacter sp.]|nr:EamA family transporter [Oscillibacter sp.]
MKETTIEKGNALRAYACILSGAALWGIIGVWNRALMARGLSPMEIVTVRTTGGMLLLCALFLFRDWSVFLVKREHLKYFFGTGVISVVLFTLCYFSCQSICSLAVASILLYTAPSFVVILSAILWREPVTVKKLWALALTLCGCALVCGIFSGGLTVTAAGILLGLGAGFFYALYSIFGRYALAHYPPMTVVVWTFLFAGPASLAVTGLSMLLSGGMDGTSGLAASGLVAVTPAASGLAGLADPVTLLLALGLAAFSTAVPYVLYTEGLAKVEAGKASIMASLEPVVASLAGVLLFHEPMGAATVLGIGCVLAGVWILR